MAKKGQKLHRYSNLYVKRRLVKLEIDVFAIISNGLIHHTPKQKTLIKIQKELDLLSVQLGLSDAERNNLWIKFYNQYLHISQKTIVSLKKIERKFGKKEDYEQSLVQRRGVIYSCIRAKILNNDLIKDANQVMYSYEQRLKHDQMREMLDVAEEDKSPFFLCSAHPKPAKDHADWEGKLYYDEDWESYVPDDQKDSIRAIIRNRKLVTVQEVTGPDIYLCVRKNCRHYFKNIPTNEVLHASARSLLKKHGMIMPDELPASRNLLYYREYHNRLKVEEALHKLVPNEQLAKDITKDKKLLDKWKKTL